MQHIEKATGELYHKLWREFSDNIFNQSLDLIFKRYEINKFNLNLIKNKFVLDAGCGSGRHTVASSYLGAKKVIGLDISKSQVSLNNKKFKRIKNIKFYNSSTDNINYKDNYFDYVISNGVIHHTKDFEKSLSEVIRVCKKNGYIFLMIYGAGGFRWPLIKCLRPMAKEIGINKIKISMKKSNLSLNNIKHFVDDLFVPIQKITTQKEIIKLLKQYNVKKIKFWNKVKTLDHEENFDLYLDEFYKLRKIFKNIKKKSIQREIALDIINLYINKINKILKMNISLKNKKKIIIGEGNHRILIKK